MKNTTVKAWLVIALTITLVTNLQLGTAGAILWISAFASIFNLYLTNTRNRWFIIPDLIWIVCMLYISIGNGIFFDKFQYAFYFVIGFVQFKDWSSHTEDGIMIPKKMNDKKRLSLACVIIGGVYLMTLTADVAGGASPMLDSFNTITAFAGAYLLAKRYVEAQFLFLMSNIFSALLYASVGMASVAITFVLFASLTLITLPNWLKSAQE